MAERKLSLDNRGILDLSGLEHLAILGFFSGIGAAVGAWEACSTTPHLPYLTTISKGIFGGLGLYCFCMACGLYVDLHEEQRINGFDDGSFEEEI